jgi:hypothetical protein
MKIDWYSLYLEELKKINWEGIRQYMALVNWRHRGRNVTVEDLKACVASNFLCGEKSMLENPKKRYTRIKSGGFSVCFFVWGETPCLEIYFDISTTEETVAEGFAKKLA